jgi:ribosomal protein S27AE
VSAVTVRKRGRSRKHRWIEFQGIEEDSSPEARYLRWASVNNPALAECASSGCPRCSGKTFRLRHDKKFENIRFYCPECGFETSFHIIHPKKSLHSIEIYDTRGILVGLKNVDDYHEKTSRENADARVLIAEQKLDLGGEWFDGVSGTNSQSRYLTREEILKRIEDRKMKKLMKAMLEEIEREQQEDRASAFETDIHGDDIAD